jgi:adenylate kinase
MPEESNERSHPNILITGTPGVGKTATATLIAETLQLTHFNIGEIIQKEKFTREYDENLQTHIVDEDALLDHLEVEFENERNRQEDEEGLGGVVADYHSCEMFPERWFDLILVLRTDTHILYDRLLHRRYNEQKRNQNMECEIMQVLLEEAKESYAPEIVVELKNNTLEDMECNMQRVKQWHTQWMEDHIH